MINQLKQLPLALVLTTGAGILMHDMQIDHAATTIMNSQTLSVNASTADRTYKHDNAHLHIERPAYEKTSVPKTQTRMSDDKKYIVQKRLAGSNNSFDYIWPSD